MSCCIGRITIENNQGTIIFGNVKSVVVNTAAESQSESSSSTAANSGSDAAGNAGNAGGSPEAAALNNKRSKNPNQDKRGDFAAEAYRYLNRRKRRARRKR
jgi:hypothetical protein